MTPSNWNVEAVRDWVRPRTIETGRALVVGAVFFAAAIPLLVLTIVAIGLIPVFGVGLVLLPAVLVGVRGLADERRRLAGRWTGVPIDSPYRPAPPPASSWLAGTWRRATWLLTDPATWRDLLWLLGAPFQLALGLLPAGLIVYGGEGVLVAPLLGPQLRGGWGYGIGLLTDLPGESYLAIPQGLLLIALGLRIAPAVHRLHSQFARTLLAPTPSAELAERVDQLTRTRSDAVDAQAVELRRIERDLHDGAQARLVALGMSLGMAEDLLESDPETARRLLAEARVTGAQALTDLRDLVRGIHPPVLAERGLDGAVRAVALTLPIPVQVSVELPGRPPAPVETAAYFAVAEALANVAKHSGATSAEVRLSYLGRRLQLVVSDDGAGGANPGGSGLRGISRRLAAFDGTLTVTSPAGGPTLLIMEIPCALSSPKTSPSSATG